MLGGVADLKTSNSKTQLSKDTRLQHPWLSGDGGSLSGSSRQRLEQGADR